MSAGSSALAASLWVKELASELGFDLIGIAPAGRFPHADAFEQWLANGRAGTMAYLHEWVQERVDPTKLLPGARSVISVACSYCSPERHVEAGGGGRDGAEGAEQEPGVSHATSVAASRPAVEGALPPSHLPQEGGDRACAGKFLARDSARDALSPESSLPACPKGEERRASSGLGTELATRPTRASRDREDLSSFELESCRQAVAGGRAPADDPETSVPHAGGGRIARYALGEDYHEVLKRKVHKLADAIRQHFPGAKTKCGVDITAILEREAAALAGLGWIGKNGCLINPEWGSWLVLAEVITSVEMTPDSPIDEMCGSCTRCLDACPTGALTGPRELDARRCISYLTIEHRQPLAQEQERALGDWVFGCDTCQDVCPWNSRAAASPHPEFTSRFGGNRLNLQAVLDWSEEEYRQATRGTALRRVKLPMLQQRAQAVLENIRGR